MNDLTQRLHVAIHEESAAIAPQTSTLIEVAREAIAEIERLREGLRDMAHDKRGFRHPAHFRRRAAVLLKEHD